MINNGYLENIILAESSNEIADNGSPLYLRVQIYHFINVTSYRFPQLVEYYLAET